VESVSSPPSDLNRAVETFSFDAHTGDLLFEQVRGSFWIEDPPGNQRTSFLDAHRAGIQHAIVEASETIKAAKEICAAFACLWRIRKIGLNSILRCVSVSNSWKSCGNGRLI
jgi:hypothetical protein